MKRVKKGRKKLGVFKMVVNGQSIEGQRYEGGWFWVCPSQPHIPRDFDGSASVQPAVDSFLKRCLY